MTEYFEGSWRPDEKVRVLEKVLEFIKDERSLRGFLYEYNSKSILIPYLKEIMDRNNISCEELEEET